MTTALTTAAQAEEALPLAPPRRRRGKEDEDTRRTNWWATALIAVCSLTVLIPLYLAVVVAIAMALATLDGGEGVDLLLELTSGGACIGHQKSASLR